jgi:hypothetical protein
MKKLEETLDYNSNDQAHAMMDKSTDWCSRYHVESCCGADQKHTKQGYLCLHQSSLSCFIASTMSRDLMSSELMGMKAITTSIGFPLASLARKNDLPSLPER